VKKVLIISYFFPPSKFTAANRINSWINYLPDFGYKPYVITRNWDNNAKSYIELAKPSGNKTIIQKNKNSQIHYLPFKTTLRDKIYTKYGESKFQFVRKILSFFEVFFQNFYLYHPIYRQMFIDAEKLIKTEKIDKVIVSANPFIQFQIGFKLKKKYPNIEWIADYRDDWSTTELVKYRNPLEKLIHKVEAKSEKKWLSNAHSFTSISDYYIQKISKFISKKGVVILNGINEDIVAVQNVVFNSNEFVVTYNGTLYSTQPVESFLEAIIELITKYEHKIFIKVNFIGLAIDPVQVLRVENLINKHKNHFLITERVSKKEVIAFQTNSNLLLMLAHQNLKGISSSKLYEYIGLNKKVLLYPNDFDILESTLIDTKLGLITNSKMEIKNKIQHEIESFIKNPNKEIAIDKDIIDKYSRKTQTKKMAKILDAI